MANRNRLTSAAKILAGAATTWRLATEFQSSFGLGNTVEFGRKHLIRYRLTIRSDNPLYNTFAQWLASEEGLGQKISSKNLNAVSAKRQYVRPGEPLEEVALFYNLNETHGWKRVAFGAHKFSTLVREGNSGTQVNVNTSPRRPDLEPVNPDICFGAVNRVGWEGICTLVEHIKETYEAAQVAEANVYYLNRWGEWRRRFTPPVKRSLNSVFAPPGVVDGLVKDIEDFLASEEEYSNLDLPYHRGYLLHGHPGSGKTSLVKAIGSHFGFNVYKISITKALLNEVSFEQIIGDIPPYSMLVIEDIDVIGATVDREQRPDSEETESLGDLLNALDGVNSPYGVVYFFTTNYPERLDKALLRPGRVSRNVEMNYASEDMITAMYKHFFSIALEGIDFDGVSITGAEASELFRRNLREPGAAKAALKDFIKLKRQDPNSNIDNLNHAKISAQEAPQIPEDQGPKQNQDRSSNVYSRWSRKLSHYTGPL